MRELRSLPKAHLHLHLTGSARRTTIRELAGKHGVNLPPALVDDEFGLDQLLRQGHRDWSDFQSQYHAARRTIRSADDVRRIIREAAEDDAAEGSGYWSFKSTRVRTSHFSMVWIQRSKRWWMPARTRLAR